MFEIVVVVLLVLGLIGLALLPAGWGLYGGVIVTGVSLLFGTLAGIGYHVMLARALGGLPRGWWWNPTVHHDDLSDEDSPRVMRWFYAGAAGFFGCLVGMAMVVAGALKTI